MADQYCNLGNACRQPIGKASLSELWSDGVIDDTFSSQIGNGSLKRLCYFDAHLAVMLGNKKQQTIADAFSTNLPGIGDTVCVGGNIFRGCGRDHQDDDLRSCFLLQSRQARFQCQGLCG